MFSLLKRLFSANKNHEYRPGAKINLLIELSSFDKGGLEKVVLDSALRLDRKLFDVTIVSIGETGHLADNAEKRGLKVYGLPQKGKTESLRKIIKERNINLSNSHFSRLGYPIYAGHRIPNITYIHNIYAFLAGSALQHFRDDDKYVNRYISVSKNATRYAVEKLNIPVQKIVTVPNGLIIDEHNERLRSAQVISRQDMGLLDNDYIFLNVASYNLHKGHYLMADAMKKILRIRQDIKILCIGNVIYPPHIEDLHRYLKSSGLEKHILMPGFFPNIESFYGIVDAFLLPSFIEGWSIAMNEAMFYEKPVILTDTGASAEVIENNDIGILIKNEYGDILNLDSITLDNIAYNQREFKTADQLARSMMDFADNSETWKSAGKKGKEKILKNYNFDDIVKKYEKIYVKVLNTRRG